MSLDQLYPWLKALHVAAALTFVGGVLNVAVLLRALPPDAPLAASTARQVRRWDQAVTTPAMLLVWGLGLMLATSGQWFTAGWLQAKLVFVVILSGLHGIQSGHLRRIAVGTQSGTVPAVSWPAVLVLASAAAIAVLAVAKPI